MPITASITKRARKSIAPIRPPLEPPPSSTYASTDGTVCHLCGYLGRTRLLSIENNVYSFLRYLPPASGALPINDTTYHVRACHLCGLLLDKQRELNHTSNNFFFKGFFRSIGSCHLNNELVPKTIVNVPDEQEQSPDQDTPKEMTVPLASPQLTLPKTDESIQRTAPPPLRKTTTATTNFPLDHHSTDELSSFDSFLTSIRSRFLSEYTSVISSSKPTSHTSCHLCSSLKPYSTLFTIFKTQFEFLPSTQIDVCTLCYYHLMDQYKKQIKRYRRPRPQCYLCRSRVTFIDWEIKLLEIEHFPFLLNLSNEKDLHEQLYDNQRLALACDQCFYTLLFQYIDQQRQNVPLQQRTYSWQCTYSYENEHFFDNYDWFYT